MIEPFSYLLRIIFPPMLCLFWKYTSRDTIETDVFCILMSVWIHWHFKGHRICRGQNFNKCVEVCCQVCQSMLSSVIICCHGICRESYFQTLNQKLTTTTIINTCVHNRHLTLQSHSQYKPLQASDENKPLQPSHSLNHYKHPMKTNHYKHPLQPSDEDKPAWT